MRRQGPFWMFSLEIKLGERERGAGPVSIRGLLGLGRCLTQDMKSGPRLGAELSRDIGRYRRPGIHGTLRTRCHAFSMSTI